MNKTLSQIKESLPELIRHRWRFLFTYLVVFFISFSFLSAVGFVPEYEPRAVEESPRVIAQAQASAIPQVPVRISIPAVGVDSNIEHPESRDIAVLDAALSEGVVQYPGTGTLDEEANVFLFGHSSFLPNVINRNYQAFNGLKKLEGGEEIFVDSEDTRYVYHVSSVHLADAEEITVDVRRGTRKLTLSTCNSFGAESERYVVEARYVGSYLLAS